MGRKAIPLNLIQMQNIINDNEKNFVGTQTDFFQLCCDVYNERNNPAKPLYPAIIYTRVKKGELSTKVVSTRGNKTLSEEHKQKLLAGRKNLPAGRRKRVNTDPRHAQYIRKEFPSQPKLVDRVLDGSMAAAIKLKCIDCCCGDRESIRLCTSYGCPLYNFRPYRENVLTVVSSDVIVEENAA